MWRKLSTAALALFSALGLILWAQNYIQTNPSIVQAVAGYLTIDSNGSAITQRNTVNFISGTNATVSCVDNSGASRSDCTVSATGGGGGIVNGYGAFASRPASGTTTGDIYVASDSAWDAYRWNGASWDSFVAGMLCNNPVAGAFATQAKSTALTVDSFATSNQVLNLQAHVSSGNNLVMELRSYPATPFTIKMRFRFNLFGSSTGFDTAGIAIYDLVSDKAINYGFSLRGTGSPDFVSYFWNTVASGSATFNVNQNYTGWTFRGGMFEIDYTDDGANRSIYIVQDGGNAANKVLVQTISNTDFITPTHIGISLMPYATTSTATENLQVYHFGS